MTKRLTLVIVLLFTGLLAGCGTQPFDFGLHVNVTGQYVQPPAAPPPQLSRP